MASEIALSVRAVQLPAPVLLVPVHFQMPPCAPARRIVPSLLIVIAPIRPLIAPNRCPPPGLRSPCTIGFGPSPPQAASNVVGPLVALALLSSFAAFAPFARCAPA